MQRSLLIAASFSIGSEKKTPDVCVAIGLNWPPVGAPGLRLKLEWLVP